LIMKSVIGLLFVAQLVLAALATPVPNPQILPDIDAHVHADGIADLHLSVDSAEVVDASLFGDHIVHVDFPSPI